MGGGLCAQITIEVPKSASKNGRRQPRGSVRVGNGNGNGNNKDVEEILSFLVIEPGGARQRRCVALLWRLRCQLRPHAPQHAHSRGARGAVQREQRSG